MLRVQERMAFFDQACSLCERECQKIAAACLQLQRDPSYTDVLDGDAYRLNSMAKRLIEQSSRAQGTQLLRLAVARRLLLQLIERKEVVVWLARYHSETLSILMKAIDFDGLGLGNVDDVIISSGGRRQRKRRHQPIKM